MSPSFPGRALARMYVDIRGICASNDPILGGGGGGGNCPAGRGARADVGGSSSRRRRGGGSRRHRAGYGLLLESIFGNRYVG